MGQWLKMNIDQVGFYRVHYDKQNWQALAKQLKENHTVFSVADRSSLINDVFALTRTGHMSISDAFSLSSYVSKETKFVPFQAALDNMNYFGGMLKNRRGYQVFQKYMKSIISPRLIELEWNNTGTYMERLLRESLLDQAIKHNLSSVVQKAQLMFKEYMKTKNKPINYGSVVMKAGVIYGGRDEWDFIYNENKYSSYLAETRDPHLLNWYANRTLRRENIEKDNSPFMYMIENIARNPNGTEIAIEFLQQNWDKVAEKYARIPFLMGQVIISVYENLRTLESYHRAKEFLLTHDMGTGESAALKTLADVHNKIIWLDENEKEMVTWLEENTI